MGLFDFMTKPKPDSADFYADNYATIQKEIKPFESRIVELAKISAKSRKVTDKITALEELVGLYYKLKGKCNAMGPDYALYFSEMWEHCHNSRSPDFSYIEPYERELNELKVNFSELFAQQVTYEKASINLDEKVRKVLRENPVILQTDVYKHFDKTVREDIQSMLYFMEKNRTIRREKCGKTYKIYYNGK